MMLNEKKRNEQVAEQDLANKKKQEEADHLAKVSFSFSLCVPLVCARFGEPCCVGCCS